MKYRYTVVKKCGRTFCGSGEFKTFCEAVEFSDDGFCDNSTITDRKTGRAYKLKFKAWEVE